MSSFKCCDMGWECQFEVKGENRNDVAREVVSHIHNGHGLDVIPTDIMMKAHKAISR